MKNNQATWAFILLTAFALPNSAFSSETSPDGEVISTRSNDQRDWSLGSEYNVHFFDVSYSGASIVGALKLDEVWSVGAFLGTHSKNSRDWETFYGANLKHQLLKHPVSPIFGDLEISASFLAGHYYVQTIAWGFATQHRSALNFAPGLVVSQNIASRFQLTAGFHMGPSLMLGDSYDEETKIPLISHAINLGAAVAF